MFKGFELAYPEYEVITPHTNKSYTLRSLNVQEEEKLKGSLITPTKVAEHLNGCLFSTIVKKPEDVLDYQSFLKKNTLKDRDALLYGLYHISYEEIRNYQLRCSSCSHEYPVTIKASDTFNFEPYQKENILKDFIRVELTDLKGVSIIIKQPTLFDELHNIKLLSSRPGSTLELITETLIIDRIEQISETSTEPVIYNERVDIIDAYMELTAKSKRQIYKAYDENFGKFGVTFKMASDCPKCGNNAVYNIDLVENFFRALFSA